MSETTTDHLKIKRQLLTSWQILWWFFFRKKDIKSKINWMIINTNFLITEHSTLRFLFSSGDHSSFQKPLTFYSTMNQLQHYNRFYWNFQKKFDFIKTRGFKSNHLNVYCKALQCGLTLQSVCYSKKAICPVSAKCAVWACAE